MFHRPGYVNKNLEDFLGLKKIFHNVETYHDSLKLWNGLADKIIDFLKQSDRGIIKGYY